MRKLKVMHLIWSMKAGGAQQIVINYLRDFKDDPDIDLKLYVFTNPSDSKYDTEIKECGYNVKYLNNPSTRIKIPYIKRWFQRSISKKAWTEAIKEFNPDIVHVHISGLLSYTLEPIMNANVPLRFDTLHSDPRRYVGKDKKIICRAFNEERFIPVCVTEEQTELAKICYGINNFEVVHNGVDIKSIKNKIIPKVDARSILDLPKEAFIIAGVGRLNKIKNFSLLIDAFTLVLKEKSNAMLIIAGDGPEKNALYKQVKKYGIQDKVKFLGNQYNVIPVYCASDVLGITSISESSSLTLIEAQICGLRCVMSSGVPRESIISSFVEQMLPSAQADKWAKAFINEDFVGESVCEESDYEVHQISKKLKDIYFRYWNEYKINYNEDIIYNKKYI